MKIMKTLIPRSSLLLGGLLAIGVPALAVPITGGFGTTSAGVMTYANATNDVHKIDFCPPDPFSPVIGSGSCGGPSAAGEGILQVQGGTGTFSSIVAPVNGTILDLVDNPNPIHAPFTYFPVGVPGQAIDDFLTVSSLPTYNFRADEFINQTCAPSSTTICLGGFILTQVGTNVSVSFTVNGTIIAPGFDDTKFNYVVSGQFNSTNLGEVAAKAQATGGIFSNTWSGSLDTVAAEIPEPSTVTMFGLAAIAMLFGRLHSKRGSDS